MDIVAIMIIIIIGVILVLTFYVIGVYNRLLDARNRVEEQFMQIEIELNKIVGITERLLEISKKEIKHEDKILDELEKTNNKLKNATSINGKIKASENLNINIDKLFKLKETYPKLNKGKIFSKEQKDLTEVQGRIEYASSFYNQSVLNYNKLKEEFPISLIAKIFKFKNIDELK